MIFSPNDEMIVLVGYLLVPVRFASAHLYTWVQRDTMRSEFLLSCVPNDSTNRKWLVLVLVWTAGMAPDHKRPSLICTENNHKGHSAIDVKQELKLDLSAYQESLCSIDNWSRGYISLK